MTTMRYYSLSLFLILSLFTSLASAQTLPSITPAATYTNSDGNTLTETTISESAPLAVSFISGAENTDGWTAHYEWRFYKEGKRNAPYLIRYDKETSYTFTDAGTHRVELWATFIQGTDTIEYTNSYWTTTATAISITIAESKLEMPNAFSPNGDGINDVYKAKNGWKIIVKFEAAIYNRWGQKLYSWTDPAGGWDGKFNGKDVKQGVYYVMVKAEGADGKKYNIKRDVNLLRGFTN